ncbi:MAG: histidine phosphatase family protein [Devosia sp.]|nr:histidine phosphatase family protein [Devosia sp.]
MRLVLVRHAKSAWNSPGLPDFDRPLAPRGQRAAAWIGRQLAATGLVPDRVLCSSARRTRETLALALPALPAEVRDTVSWHDEIYEQRDDDGYVGFLAARGEAARTLMLVGHNPATAVTALGLLADRSEATRAPLVDYPTAGIAAFALDLDRWSDLAPGVGSLIGFWRPPKD